MHPMDGFQFPAVPASPPPQPPHPFPKQEEEAAGFSGSSVFNVSGDHRQRRRNRTTQSCWSCHQAKRRCDRKRPCSRCIQLGLTGLCVYETDDPAARDDPTLPETQRLRNRIAELEKLVRELKNKPHPKWVPPGGVFKGGVNGSAAGAGANGTSVNGSPMSAPAGGGSRDPWHRLGEGAGTPMDTDYPSSSSSGYRFPPLNTLPVPLSLSLDGGNNGSSSTPGGYSDPTGSYYLDNRRPSLVSNASTNTGASSPRTPYMSGYYPSSSHPGHSGYTSSNGYSPLSANPCTCLSSVTSDSTSGDMDMDHNGSPTTTVANRLARAIRNVILESNVAHPFGESCKVLSLVRELEGIASAAAAAAAASVSASAPNGAPASSMSSNTSTGTYNATATNGYHSHAFYNGTHAHTHGGHSPPPPSLTPSTTTTATTSSSPSPYANHAHAHAHSHSHQQQQQHPHAHHQHPHAHPHQQQHAHLSHSHSHLGISSLGGGVTIVPSHQQDSAERTTGLPPQPPSYSSYATSAGYYSAQPNGGTNTSPSLSPPTGLAALGVGAD